MIPEQYEGKPVGVQRKCRSPIHSMPISIAGSMPSGIVGASNGGRDGRAERAKPMENAQIRYFLASARP